LGEKALLLSNSRSRRSAETWTLILALTVAEILSYPPQRKPARVFIGRDNSFGGNLYSVYWLTVTLTGITLAVYPSSQSLHMTMGGVRRIIFQEKRRYFMLLGKLARHD
jgi:hypothetical protein